MGRRRVNTNVADETYVFHPTELRFQLSKAKYQDNLKGHLVICLAEGSLLWSQRLAERRGVRVDRANSGKCF